MLSSRYNAITYSKKLQEAGLSLSIAQVQAEQLQELVNNELATKQDLFNVEISIRKDLITMSKSIKNELTIRLGGMLIATIAILEYLHK